MAQYRGEIMEIITKKIDMAICAINPISNLKKKNRNYTIPDVCG